MNELILDHDPLTGVTDYFSFDPDTEEVTIRTEYDLTDLVEYNKDLYKEFDNPRRFGKGFAHRVASIPDHLYLQMWREGKIHDQQYLKRWLNDPDNKVFRTRPGKI